MRLESNHMNKLAYLLLTLHLFVGMICFLLVRYNDEHAEDAINKYPWVLDVHLMLYGGFGFLMTFLRRFGFSALGLTMMLIVVATETGLAVNAMLKVDDVFIAHIDLFDVLEGGLASAAVLISLGAVLGKLNMLQLVTMAIIESIVFALNAHVGYRLLGALDVGGAIFVHTFGAYFGLAVALVHKPKETSLAESNYVSDITAMVGTILLFVFWPSFNALLAADENLAQRAILNTYLSLMASAAIAFVVSILCDPKNKLSMVDVQNATLAGGVAVGAVADMITRPFTAMLCGSVVGTISVIGYRRLQSILEEKLRLHDTCGVNNLHGMPGLISGVGSAIVVVMADSELYGDQMFYKLFPLAVPTADSDDYESLSRTLNIEAGEGRTQGTQALMQIVALVLTMAVAIIAGLATGVVIGVDSVFHPLESTQLFNDANFWAMPDEEQDHSVKKDDDFAGLNDCNDPNEVITNNVVNNNFISNGNGINGGNRRNAVGPSDQ